VTGTREPLLLPAVALAAGIALSRAVEFTLTEATLATAVLFAISSLSKIRVTRTTGMLLSIAGAGIALDLLHRTPTVPQLDAEPGEFLILSGCVVQPGEWSEDRVRFTLELEPAARARVTIPVSAEAAAPRLLYGERVELEARVRLPRNFRNPGGFDYAAYLARRDIYWSATAARDATLTRLPGSCGWPAAAVLHQTRALLAARIRELFPNDAFSSGMLSALLIGDASRLERVYTDDFRRTGTYHALVISGMHLTLLASILLFCLRWLPMHPAFGFAFTAAAGWVYALLAGGGAEHRCAAAGLTTFCVARLLYRRTRVLNVLAAVAIAFLATGPDQLFEASFQLSFLAVAALGGIAAPALDRYVTPYHRAARDLGSRRADVAARGKPAAFRVELKLIAETIALLARMPRALALSAVSASTRLILFAGELLLLSAVMQVALALPMALYFHRVSFTGLTANLLMGPLMSLLIPLALIATLTASPPAGVVSGRLLAAAAWVAKVHAAREPEWRIADPPLWSAAVFAAALLALAIALRRGSRWIAPAACAAVAAFALLILWPPAPDIRAGQLELTAIDVGQGDSLLLVFPNGRTMLVDGGGIPKYGSRFRPRLDTGEDVVSPYLWSRGITRLDLVAATHPHEDHTGGLPAILRNFRPRELWLGGAPADSGWSNLTQSAQLAGVPLIRPLEGDIRDFGDASVRVLSPPRDGSSVRANDASLVFLVTFGQTRFLLTGDIEQDAESRLLDSLGPVDVLKVAHHGGKSSTSEPFLRIARPAFAIVSAGAGNLFRHPHPDVLARLQASPARLFRTDASGLITIRSDGRRITAGGAPAGIRSPIPVFDVANP
jgi:competence protein ComEC